MVYWWIGVGVEKSMMLELRSRSQQALDWAEVLDLIAAHCALSATVSWLDGLEQGAGPLLSDSADESVRRFQMVDEIWRLMDVGESIPVAMVRDCREEWRLIEQGAALELHQWVRLSSSVVALQDLYKWLVNHFEVAPGLMAEFRGHLVDPVMVDTLRQSFDESGQLNENYYPSLGRLREPFLQSTHATRATDCTRCSPGRIRSTAPR